MAKRRTRKQKKKAKHPFELSWKPDQHPPSKASVKGQFTKTKPSLISKAKKKKLAKDKAKPDNLASIKADIMKSLFWLGLIVGLELVIYLAWR